MNVPVRSRQFFFDDAHPDMQRDQQILRTGSEDEKDDAWNRIFLRCEKPALRFVLRRASWLNDLAMDLVQKAFMKVYRHYDPSRPLGSYLARALDNAIKDAWDERRRRNVVSLDDECPAAMDVVDLRQALGLRRVIDGMDVRKAMARLDQADWVLLTLRYVDGWDVTEIAHARGLVVSAISTQIKKALQRLHRELSRIR